MKTTNLYIGYQSAVVSKNIDFELHKGEFCAIVGVNGIGKSTLLRTLAGLQPKLSGEIKIEDAPLESFSPVALSKKISLVLTEPIASKNLSVKELIALGRQPYTNWLGTLTTSDHEIIEHCLTLLDLKSMENKKCYALSDGQLQRVLIARAVVQNTPIILLDEPTTHLDLAHKVQILKLLKEQAHTFNKTVLFTSHEIDLAIQLCDKILIIDGNQNPFGTPCELIEQQQFEKMFPSEMILFDAKTGSFKVNK